MSMEVVGWLAIGSSLIVTVLLRETLVIKFA